MRHSNLLIAALALTFLVGCTGVPLTTRTGEIHDVKVEEGITPIALHVVSGDEVRWVNHRAAGVRIDFIAKDLDDLACQRGFKNWLGVKKESATLDANESASLCFSKDGVYRYNVRMDSALPGGKEIVQGTITVGRERAAVR